ncbi:site-2 protease family protein [Actinotalea sp. M2MS4P-6]|uniref:site-2 protease family protein n=1 Tax=Actinotalea sp. M2MS4P-6 TaxID=2983762 RepID=UPI0021E4F9D4|nr:site-2 protease family protein [Actinotalea sp. M2MS4P-6]MCV2394810.1 site-2 protease family protein [Actinotalea sp. M2MS4P-6]
MDVRAWGRGWVVGRVTGIPVVLSPGWMVAAVALVVLVLPYASQAVGPDGTGTAWLLATATVALLFASTFLHEVAHALVARRHGMHVEKIALTLLGGHTELGGQAPGPKASALVAIAGPVSNLAIAACAWLLRQALPGYGAVAALVLAVAVTNTFVGVLNLLPGLPLDGGFVLEATVWAATGRRAAGTTAAAWVGRGLAVAMAAWALWPVLTGAPDLTRALWGLLVASFVWSGAGQALQAAAVDTAVQRLVLADLAQPAVAVDVRATVADLDTGPAGVLAVLVHAGAVVGFVDPAAAGSVPAPLRAGTPLEAVATPLPPEAQVPGALTGHAAVEAVRAASRRSPVMVVLGPDGGVAGLLRTADVVRALRTG